jgi:hypothetical protein
MNRIRMMALVLGAAATTAVAGDKLWIAGPGGIDMMDTTTGQVTPSLFWIAGVQALARNGSELLVAGEPVEIMQPGGVPAMQTWIRRDNLHKWPLQNIDMFVVPGAVRAMTVAGGDLILGMEDGAILNVDPQSGAIRQTRQAVEGITAILVEGSTLYIGCRNTAVLRTDVSGGSVDMVTACGGSVRSMAWHNNELLIGTDNALFGAADHIYRINPGNGAYYGVTPIGFPAAAMSVQNGQVLVADQDGVVRRVDAVTGQVEAVVGDWNPLLSGVNAALVATPGWPCPADVNRDGVLTPADFTAMVTAYRVGDFDRADITLDLELTPADFTAMLQSYRAGCPR